VVGQTEIKFLSAPASLASQGCASSKLRVSDRVAGRAALAAGFEIPNDEPNEGGTGNII
jgi:hypothetical protein